MSRLDRCCNSQQSLSVISFPMNHSNRYYHWVAVQKYCRKRFVK
jgi:hypothetical protein